MAPSAKIHSRKQADGEEVIKRLVVIDPDKCKPNSTAYAYLRKYAGDCGKDCIQVGKKSVHVSEQACSVCVTRCKQCPGGAVSVVKLPSNLTTDTTHRYGPNSFKIHGLPIPRPGHVLGLLGTNGTGKSTALSILCGTIKPNLGKFESPSPEWVDIINYYRGSDLQNYFSHLLDDNLRVVVKPQLEASFAKRLKGKNVREMMKLRDERGQMERYAKALDLEHLMDREIQDLSGGELQRFAIACTMCRDADVYMFDEVTSFLDIKQRLEVTRLIRSLVHGGDAEWPDGELSASKKYVIVVEHDLAILDYMSDFVQCLYGEAGAYGVVTSRSRVRNGINQFLAGYIPSDNMRFRDHELTFKVTTSDFHIKEDDAGKDGNTEAMTGVLKYPDMDHTLVRKNEDGEVVSSFTLHVKSGSFRDGECIVLIGENGCGKTTFMELLAGRTKEQRGKEASIGSWGADEIEDGTNPSMAALGVSYKMQGMNPKLRQFKGTVQELLEQEINVSLADRSFRLLVMKALKIDALSDLPVASLSGGEMQRISITICLGTPALVYLIDEPSAALDCEQRVVAAKVMKRWVVNHLGRTLFLVEHDFVMASAMADKVIVYEGNPGVECTALPPCSVADGFNRFLKKLDVTFRRDPINFRPRINKRGSRLDRIQKANGEYYLFDVDEDDLHGDD
mmetsp:Transcript_24982/g.41465  ORF Transcript_24982/g.41465 Transcript_24982/m.41465 type:complete len:677 (-) Transcript_24982:234-2264(-)|eukprot:CAMPEP_0119005918 /NCGR_PEP_ID=MMETSP1176-20130426/2003_1 /TAXON_ID=265551 /ORGANISM="Synedropsis recta cf, Strain CCMP1620" /LENGTH=676 /DNA_ID=CAMNT_0006957777 /DNA_START=137 /DNA_END=2170 /DNA_ORIENTATION=+